MNHSRNLAFAILTNSPYDCAGAAGLAMRDNWRGDGHLMARAVAIASEIRDDELFTDNPLFYLNTVIENCRDDILDRLRDTDFHTAVLRQQGYNQFVDELEEDFADHLVPFADEIRAANPEQVRALNVSPAMKAALLRILED